MLESGDTRILLDAGVKLGKNDEYPLIDAEDIKHIDAVLVTHAHLDHSAYLPHLITAGYNGSIYCTKPTFELINILVSDYIAISNPKGVSKEGLAKMQKCFKLVEYHKEFKIKNLSIKFIPAGHILGSAMIEVKDGKDKALYTGDVNFKTTKLLDAAYTENLNSNILITESTYGADNDIFPPDRAILNAMVSSIKETVNKGGKIIIPSFGVGRAQEIMLVLDDYMRSGVLQTVPIYTDGMVNKAMRIHRHNVIYCRDELQKRILLNDDDPFKSKNFVPVTTVQERRRIMKSGGDPGIIVTTSGMLTGGPILKYLEHMGNDVNNKMMFVGYQAAGTRGRELTEGAKEISIGQKKVKISLSIEQYHLSAHADRPQLVSFTGKIQNLSDIFIVHGEQGKSKQLAEALKKKYKTYIPTPKSEFTL